LNAERGKRGLGFGKQRAIMDFTAEKKESENNSANNPENAHQTLDSSSQLASAIDSNSKETEERQSRELKAGLHPLKVFLPHFHFCFFATESLLALSKILLLVLLSVVGVVALLTLRQLWSFTPIRTIRWNFNFA